jgi:hypothetical protein
MAVNDTDPSSRDGDAPGARPRRTPTGLTAWSAAWHHGQNGTVAWPGTPLSWRHGPDTIALVIGDRVMPVPDAVATPLLRNPRHTITHDPAVDLLLAEQDLRWTAALLAGHLADAAHDIGLAREEVAAAQDEPGWVGRHSRGAASAHLADAQATHNALAEHRQRAVDALAATRSFVIGAAVPDGWLAEAARGWQRHPAPPPWVPVFATEAAFVAADTRRGEPTTWGGVALAGRTVGWEWRRDGDDDDPLAEGLHRSGMWWLFHLAVTGEIFASRHNSYLPEEVWLLGRTFFDPAATHTLLSTVEFHMREPNSLLLAADVVHEVDEPIGECGEAEQ